jgi:AcrR family transcriptional regulator
MPQFSRREAVKGGDDGVIRGAEVCCYCWPKCWDTLVKLDRIRYKRERFEGHILKIEAESATDGRRLRSERSRLAIIEAALSLQDDGVLLPTAQQISDRAGVGIRSFFRHFEDMESLFACGDDHIRDSYEALFLGGDRSGSLEERIDRVAIRYADAYEKLTNKHEATRAQLWRYEILRKNYARNQRGLRKDLEKWLPELKQTHRLDREAIHAIASFDMWHRLRYHQGLSKQTAINVIVNLLTSQLSQ